MDNLKLIFRLYFSPASAMSDIMDKGSWLFAAGIVLVVSIVFFATVNARLETAYHIPTFDEFHQPGLEGEDEARAQASYRQAGAAFSDAMAKRQTVPVAGDRFFTFFSFDPSAFYQPLLLISIFYV